MSKYYKSKILTPEFFQRVPIEAARLLLGKYLVRELKEGILVGKIVETEAYLAIGDPAAHTYKGKTPRNLSLFKPAGYAYVHSMRQHCLLDIVVGSKTTSGSVLIRAVEPIDGVELMKANRHSDNVLNLCSGPGKLCEAFAITRELDGVEMTSDDSTLFVVDLGYEIEAGIIMVSPRVGISKAREELRRFTIKDNLYTSR